MRSKQTRKRRGAAAVEAAVVLPMVIVGIFVLLDLSMMVLRQNALTAAASHIARHVSIRGADHPMDVQELGPAPLQTTVSDLGQMHAELQPLLPTFDGSEVRVGMRWHDRKNSSGYPVAIELTYTHRSILGRIVPWHENALRAETSVTIIN